jgi:peptide/nickel transport system substrate-binding protein
MKRILLSTLLITLLFSMPLALSAQTQDDAVVLASTSQPPTLMRDFNRTAIGALVMGLIYNNLVKSDFDGNIVPDLAESWEVSEDQRTWTFKLREDVLWQDGVPLTAEDIKFTFEMSAHPDYVGVLYDATLLGAEAKKNGEADEVEGVKVIDDYTISLTTVDPNSLFLESTFFGQRMIMPAHLLKDIPVAELVSSEQVSRPIGTGPYHLVDWKADELLEFEAFDDHFAGRPNLSRIFWRIIPDTSVQVTELLNGTLDIITAVPADDFSLFTDEPGFATLNMPGVTFYSIFMNTSLPYFNAVGVRRAMSHAIDKESLILAVASGQGTVTTSWVHPSLPQYNPELEGYAFDPDLARELLAEAGWSDDDGDGIIESHGVEGLDDGTPFSVELGTLPDLYSLQAQVIQQNLATVGIETEINVVDFNIYFAEYVTSANPDYQMAMSAWFNLIVPTHTELVWSYASYSRSYHQTLWQNQELEDLLVEIPQTFDIDQRNQLYYRVEEITEEELPILFLIRLDDLVAHRENLIVPQVSSLSQLLSSIPQWEWAS